MRFTCRSFYAVIACFLLAGLVLAADAPSPLKLVEITVNDVVAEMNANQELYTEQPEKLQSMVLERVAPHFDFQRMTQLALAKNWSSATPAQREQITNELLQMIVRNYSNAMFTFRNTPIKLLSEKLSGERSARVRLSVTNSNTGNLVDVILRMEHRNSNWQVVDVVVDGVSMVITYRGTFDAEVSKGGIEGLIASIKANNVAN
ncbi:MAG: ABC transporter substrate-binding protein [Gammaproteobacteria bacterium]|nr:ABC transporter substrate-binding protein [Gammaproteobacteria bacterium]